MRKAVFFDIDGTLWDDNMRIPPSTIEAIRTLRENGSYAFICSGRSRSNIRDKRLLDIGFDGIVAACGAYIEFGQEKIYEKLLTKEQVDYALSVIKKHRTLAVLEGPKYTYVNDDVFQDDPYVQHLRRELGEDVLPIEGTEEFEINKLSVDMKGADVNAFLSDVEDRFDTIAHNDWLLEIVPQGYSKATGIAKVCELLDIEKENTYAFGDSPNDHEMLRFVAHGIAMGNGTEETKQHAEYVTSDIMDDGIKNGLLYYGLI